MALGSEPLAGSAAAHRFNRPMGLLLNNKFRGRGRGRRRVDLLAECDSRRLHNAAGAKFGRRRRRRRGTRTKSWRSWRHTDSYVKQHDSLVVVLATLFPRQASRAAPITVLDSVSTCATVRVPGNWNEHPAATRRPLLGPRPAAGGPRLASGSRAAATTCSPRP